MWMLLILLRPSLTGPTAPIHAAGSDTQAAAGALSRRRRAPFWNGSCTNGSSTPPQTGLDKPEEADDEEPPIPAPSHSTGASALSQVCAGYIHPISLGVTAPAALITFDWESQQRR